MTSGTLGLNRLCVLIGFLFWSGGKSCGLGDLLTSSAPEGTVGCGKTVTRLSRKVSRDYTFGMDCFGIDPLWMLTSIPNPVKFWNGRFIQKSICANKYRGTAIGSSVGDKTKRLILCKKDCLEQTFEMTAARYSVFLCYRAVLGREEHWDPSCFGEA